jgi:D-alanyl-D-alanine carboxypeptidase/D-alanyl-D-alanine-endopeptidase (penicillin-binding protein 4)
MRRWLRAAALTAAMTVGTHGFAQQGAPHVAPSTLAATLDAMITRARLPGATLGVVVVEAASGNVLYEHDPDVPLNPASNAKVLTAAAALSILGADHRFYTSLYGNVQGHAITSALVLKGDGDPSLRTADLYDLARQLRRAGVRRVEGDLVVDDSWFGAQHLPPAFEQQPNEHAAFRAAVGAVSVDENAMTLFVRPAASAGTPAIVTVDPPGYLDVEGTINTVEAGDPVSVSLDVGAGADGRERARVGGTFPVGAPTTPFRRRLDNPGLAAGYVMRAMLDEVGIEVRGRVRIAAVSAPGAGGLSGLTRLARRESAPLSTLLYEVGKDSNNFYAEMVLLAVAAATVPGDASAPVTFERGAARVLAWARAAGVRTDAMVIRNGSGLFDANRVSARQISEVLRAALRDPTIRDEYVAQLAVGGDDGTLRTRLRIDGAARRVRAKTGTLDDVIALSGYVLSADPSSTLVFSFVSNGVRNRGAVARQLADQIVTAVVRHVVPAPEVPAAPDAGVLNRR